LIERVSIARRLAAGRRGRRRGGDGGIRSEVKRVRSGVGELESWRVGGGGGGGGGAGEEKRKRGRGKEANEMK